MLIAELICSLFEPCLKFKTPVSIYCNSSQCYWKLFICVIVNCVNFYCIINQIIISLLLKVFVYVIRLIPSIAAKQNFLKVWFICLCILRDNLWYINISRSFAWFWPAVCLGSGELNFTQRTYKLNTAYTNCLRSFRTLPSFNRSRLIISAALVSEKVFVYIISPLR